MNSIIATEHEAAGLAAGRVTLLVRPVPLDMIHDWDENGPWTMDHFGDYHRTTEYSPWQPGNTYAVREKCAIGFCDSYDLAIDYHADGKRGVFETDTPAKVQACAGWINDNPRSAAQMPLWAARTRVEVVNVACVRLQDVTEEQAIASGVRSTRLLGGTCTVWSVETYPTPDIWDTALLAFKSYWDRKHSIDPFVRNDWVWLISVKSASTGVEIL